MIKDAARRKFRQLSEKLPPNWLFYGLLIALPTAAFYYMQSHQYQIVSLFFNQTKRQELIDSILTTAQDFLTLTLGIIVEALPFVILGVAISALIQAALPTDKLIKKLPKNKFCRRLIVSFLGIAMPVCECGNVPVARSLMVKGFSSGEAITFLLAAPSVNLVTFIVTWEAFGFNHSVAVVRVLATLILANLTAVLVVKLVSRKKLLTKAFAATCQSSRHAPRSLARLTELFRSEMWLITRLLVIGAMIAAASQTLIPREAITAIASNPLLSVVAMLGLAFIISICSSVDAFFALAYVNTFSLGSILAFLVAGPMVDIKMIAMMKTTLTFRALALIAGCVLIGCLIIGMVFSYVW